MKTIWISQRELAESIGCTAHNIILHVGNLRSQWDGSFERLIPTQQIEGGRRVVRNIKCVSIHAAHAIAIKSRNFSAAERMRKAARRNGVRLREVLPARKEIVFAELLHSLSDVVEVVPQQGFGRYVVDFFIPSAKLAIEYDEKSHASRAREDAERQSWIEANFGVSFLRVKEGREMEGFRRIVTFLFKPAPYRLAGRTAGARG